MVLVAEKVEEKITDAARLTGEVLEQVEDWSAIVIERDAGATVQVSSGLSGGERVVKLASAELAEGRAVEVRK